MLIANQTAKLQYSNQYGAGKKKKDRQTYRPVEQNRKPEIGPRVDN